MMVRILALGLALCAFLGLLKAADDLLPIPATPKKPVTDDYHGVSVVDDYRWLEGSAPAVREWSGQQNARTRSYLDHLPSRPDIVEQLKRLEGNGSTRFGALTFRSG